MKFTLFLRLLFASKMGPPFCFSIVSLFVVGSDFPSPYFGAKEDWGEIVNTDVLMSDTHLVYGQ